ncbi:spore cortex biosynthesis protein YabQ [Ornithinibacillus bavariensis]|uniref:spore cortex biosynthesis protein YabQ n=1 Tax=Ornithinibacillus bavariensis TaxID=545502 RepID=UPI003D1D846D
MTLSVQFITMISMITGGIYLGMALDTFRRFQRHWKHNVFFLYFMEISFWLTQTFILYYTLYSVNAGELRVYVFVACLLGFATYQALLSNLYKRILERIISIMLRIYQFFTKLLQWTVVAPIKYIFRLLFASVILLFNTILIVIGFTLKILFLPIKWIAMLVYRLLPKKIKLFLHHLAGFCSKIQNICKRCLTYITSKWR